MKSQLPQGMRRGGRGTLAKCNPPIRNSGKIRKKALLNKAFEVSFYVLVANLVAKENYSIKLLDMRLSLSVNSESAFGYKWL